MNDNDKERALEFRQELDRSRAMSDTPELGFDPKHPPPWRLEIFGGTNWIKDATGTVVTTVDAKWPRGVVENRAAIEAAERIVAAVNSYMKKPPIADDPPSD